MNEDRFNPLKVVRWTDRIKATLEGVATGPIRANLDLTNLCNHGCAWCEPLEYREQSVNDKRHTLSRDVAAEVIRDLADMGCEAVYFSGGGEPTLHKDFGELLKQAHDARMKTFVITNGSRIKRWGPYLQSYADHIRVSLDASCEEEHMAIHGSKPGEFGDILEGVKFLLTFRQKNRDLGPEIGFSYTMELRNSAAGSIGEAMNLAEILRVDFIQFRPVSQEKGDYCAVGDSEFKKMAAAICPRVKVLKMDWRNTDVLTQREFGRCYSALLVAVIGATGEVHACCDNRLVAFGNVNEKRLKEIWLSDMHRVAAAAISPAFCPRCLQCGFNRSVEKYVVDNESLVEFV